MVRVHGKDRSDILKITTKIGLKDDDGNNLTWDKAMEQYPDLKTYCDENPDVADAAHRLLHRNRGAGTHAAGLIIADRPINALVPLVRGKDGLPTSAFVEGLHGTDLGPLGLIKFDLLVITNLMQIAIACRIIKERHGVTSICALPGQSDWSDTAYLDDPAAIALASEAKLKCIFQFDSDGIRELVRRGGVDNFEDLAAYSALYRPGPMGLGMHDVFVARKRGHEKYTLHPVLQPILGMTYGVMVYQEQVMKILRAVGNVPDMHCEIVRKAISKKKIEIFGRYKEMFLKNGQEILGWDEARVSELWDQIEAFAEYGFNKSHTIAYTYVSSRLLWLKAHYPLEFFTAILSCCDDTAKLKGYRQEAESMGISIGRVTLNKSKVKFDIVDDAIYMGFSNIKGVGEEIAARIVAGQPYRDFEDFLKRFGTEANVVKALIALRVFEGDPVKLYLYYEYYKAEVKKLTDSVKRTEESYKKYALEVELILSDVKEIEGPEGPDISSRDKLLLMFSALKAKMSVKQLKEFTVDEKYMSFLKDAAEFDTERAFIEYMQGADCPWKLLEESEIRTLWKVVKKYKKTKSNAELELDGIASLEDFESATELTVEMKELLCEVPQIAESKFYGFSWRHLLESSPDFQGDRTFFDFDEDETITTKACEVHVIERPRRKESKSKNKTVYYTVLVEDANSKSQMITFWSDDYDRFKEELEYWESDVRKGNFLSIRLKKPEQGWQSYTFDAPAKQNRWKEIPKDKNKDYRIVVLARPSQLDEVDKVESLVSPKNLINLKNVLVV